MAQEVLPKLAFHYKATCCAKYETFLKKVVEKQFLPKRVSKKTTVKAD